MVKKQLKLKQSGKPPNGVVRRLRVKRQVEVLRGVPKGGSFVISGFFFIFLCKKIDNKSISGRRFSFVNPESAHCLLKDFKKCRRFRCTGLLRSSKLIQLDLKNVAAFTQNLVQNLIDVVFSSKNNRNWSKTKVVREIAKWRRSEAKG